MAIRASAAACDITPDDPIALAGFTGLRRMSQGSHTPLLASAIHIRGGAGGVIVVSLDLHSLGPSYAERIRTGIASATGTRTENVFVAATGTASAPFAELALYVKNDPCYMEPDSDYMDHVVEMSVKAASEAAVSSRPASVAIVNFETRGTGAFVVKGENGRVIAAVIVNADVPDYMGPDNVMASADFVGILRNRLISKFGGEPVIAYMPAPAGDHVLKGRDSYGISEAENAAQVLASGIMAKLKGLKASDFMPNIFVGGRLLDLYSLPRKNLPSITDASALLNAATQMSIDGKAADETQRKFARWALIEANRTMSTVMAYKEGKLEPALQQYDPVYVQSLKIGPLQIAGLPCSVLHNCASQIMQKCDKDIWLIQGVNGTLMGSLLTCGGETIDNARLLSAVYEREVAGRLISSLLKVTTGE